MRSQLGVSFLEGTLVGGFNALAAVLTYKHSVDPQALHIAR